MSEVKKKYHCSECDKYYKSRFSLSNHRRRYHKKENQDVSQNVSNVSIGVSQNVSNVSIDVSNVSIVDSREVEVEMKCKYCNRKYKHRSSRSRHEKTCKKKTKDKSSIKNKYEEEIQNLKLQVQKLMNEKCKMHYKTLNKINNNLKINNGNQINKNNCIEHINNIHHNKINVNIIELGRENLFDVLTEKERLYILKHRYGSIEKLIQHVHFNDKYPQFHNIIVTNINNNIAYMYDKNSNQFQAVEKSKLLERILDSRSNDVESFYEVDQAKLIDRDRHALEQLLDDINKDDKQAKTEKYKAIKIIAHNNLSKILDKYKKEN